MFTPSPIRSPSASSTTSPRWMPMRNWTLPVGPHPGVPLDQAVLHLDPAADRVDHAAKLHQDAVAGALDHPPVVNGDARIDEIAAKGPEAGENAILVRAREPRISDNVGDQNGREFTRHNHQPGSDFGPDYIGEEGGIREEAERPTIDRPCSRGVASTGAGRGMLPGGAPPPEPIAGIAGCGWCAGPEARTGRSTVASSEIRRRSAYSACRPPPATGVRRARPRRPPPCGG